MSSVWDPTHLPPRLASQEGHSKVDTTANVARQNNDSVEGALRWSEGAVRGNAIPRNRKDVSSVKNLSNIALVNRDTRFFVFSVRFLILSKIFLFDTITATTTGRTDGRTDGREIFSDAKLELAENSTW